MVDPDPDILNTIITGDVTWSYFYNPQTKQQSSKWKSPISPKKQTFHADRLKAKVKLRSSLTVMALFVKSTCHGVTL
jgi:hypothetical protein